MIKHLIKLANHLDNKGLIKEADYLDAIIRSASKEPKLKIVCIKDAIKHFNDNVLKYESSIKIKDSDDPSKKNYKYFSSGAENASSDKLYALVNGNGVPFSDKEDKSYLKQSGGEYKGITLYKLE